MQRLKRIIENALTRKVPLKRNGTKKLVFVTILPEARLVYGVLFAMLSLVSLILLEALHMVFLKTWNSEIFAAITSLIGAIVGIFVSHKGS